MRFLWEGEYYLVSTIFMRWGLLLTPLQGKILNLLI
jgi:hypothetical protein